MPNLTLGSSDSIGSCTRCIRPSSPTMPMLVWLLSISCWQLRMIFSKTGCVSATELLMTCSTSAVAVCRSSASCVSRNSRAFSIAISA